MKPIRAAVLGLLAFVILARTMSGASGQPLFFEDFKAGYATNWKAGFPWEPDSVLAPTFLQVNPATTPTLNPFSVTADGLRIVAAKTSDPAARGRPYYTGLLTSKFTRIYGYFEFVAKLPSGPGAVNGALWLYPIASSGNAEIDVVEHVANYVMQTVWDGSAHNPTQATNVADVTTWHSYAVDWQPNTITLYIDGIQKFQTPTPANSKTVPMQIVLSINIQDPTSDGTALPDYMTVKSVGVWASKAKHDAAPTLLASPPTPNMAPKARPRPVARVVGNAAPHP